MTIIPPGRQSRPIFMDDNQNSKYDYQMSVMTNKKLIGQSDPIIGLSIKARTMDQHEWDTPKYRLR